MTNGLVAAAPDATPTPDIPNHAGVVIRHGDGRVTYASVAFVEEEIDGIELLRRSGVEQVTISFGGLGEGVCMLEGEGCSATECRRRVCQAPGTNSPYWRSFGLDEMNAWSPFALGASATAVHDGDLHLWSWTSADPGLAPLTLAEVMQLAGAGEDEPRDAGEAPLVSVRTVYPAGFAPTDDDGFDPLAYAAAGGVLIAIGGGALYAVRRGRRSDRPADRDTWEAA